MTKRNKKKWRLDYGNSADKFLSAIGGGKPGGGTVSIAIVRAPDVLSELLFDPAMQRSAQGIARWLKIVMGTKPGDGLLCLACELEFNQRSTIPVAFLITEPYLIDTERDMQMLVTGVCPTCSQRSNDELLAVARAMWFRANPNARDLPPEGHA